MTQKLRIVLACAGGMSTSLLVTKMQEAANELNREIEIFAIGVNVSRIKEIQDEQAIDILLLGPQIRFVEAEVRKNFPDMMIQVIDMRDYGMMNGKKVLQEALQLIEG